MELPDYRRQSMVSRGSTVLAPNPNPPTLHAAHPHPHPHPLAHRHLAQLALHPLGALHRLALACLGRAAFRGGAKGRWPGR
jgi:hypothetical protein